MEFVAAGLAVQGLRHVNRHLQDSKKLEEELERSSTDLKYLHEFLSCLVDNVYADEKGEHPKISCTSLGYRLIKPENPSQRWRLFEKCEHGPNGAVHSHVLDNESGEARDRKVKLPKYIVAVRGTIISQFEDLKDDLKIVFDLICGRKEFVMPLMKELSDLHSNTFDEDVSVWVAGHSLGAVLALVATFTLAEEKSIVIPPHLFNFPDITIDVLFKKVIEGTANGWGAAARYIPFVGGGMNRVFRRAGRKSANMLDKFSKTVVGSFSGSEITDAYQRREALRQAGYFTYMYTNQHDAISNESIQRSLNPSVPMSFLTFVASLVSVDRAPDSCYLIPPMILFTNHRAAGIYQAHKITQWYLYETVELTSVRVG